MPFPILATKLYAPPPRARVVLRPRLIARLNEALQRKLILISAPAGFGKTTLVADWAAGCGVSVAWLSLDQRDSDPLFFLSYLVAALETIAPNTGARILGALESPQPPSTEAILTTLLNDICAIGHNFVLVLDDYHAVDSKAVDDSLAFLLEHLPSSAHLVIATREDPQLPLARLRARDQLVELRAADLRFTPAEAADFLNQVMGMYLSAQDVAALETRTEGWIAGLQLAAISMQKSQDIASFIKSFTGSHHFILDYLVQEVLQQQSSSVQTFLLRTSILDRLCGPLCDAVVLDPEIHGQETLEYLERANLFIVSLDDERHWYRYHHLFSDFLRQRLQQSAALPADEISVAELHTRASQWCQDNGLVLEAFHHATTANDIDRAERLIQDKAMPLHYRSAVTTILDWLASLPATVLEARPSLLVKHATMSLAIGQTVGAEEHLQAAERALQGADLDDKTRDLVGIIAAARAILALSHYQPQTIIVQSHRAQEYLDPNNLPFRFTAIWTLAFAYHLLGDRRASAQAYTHALSISQASGDLFSTVLALTDLGQVLELENQLGEADETYRRILQIYADYPPPNACEAHLGLARINYEWNDLDAAEQYGLKSLELARQYDKSIDRFISSEVFLARLKLIRGDVTGAGTMLAQAGESARQLNPVYRTPEVAAAQVLVLLREGNLAQAGQLAQAHNLSVGQARVLLAQGDLSAALAVLQSYREQMQARGWQDEILKAMVLQAVVLYLHDEQEQAVQLLGQALALAEPGGFIRLFVDEGLPMAQLLSEAVARGIQPEYTRKLLAAFAKQTKDERRKTEDGKLPVHPSSSVDSLTPRELEVLRLIAQGLSNQEISERLVLALDTVKGHNRRIFDKLQVQRRTEAVARARELGLL